MKQSPKTLSINYVIFLSLFFSIMYSPTKIFALNQPEIPTRRGTFFESDSDEDLGLGDTSNFVEEQKTFRLVIDPGHGGIDYGVLGILESDPGFRLREKDLTLDIAQRIQNNFLENTHHEVSLTRNNDKTLPLTDRTTFANHHKADLFLSLHFNAHFHPALKEFQIYISSYSDEELERYAHDKLNWNAAQRMYLADSRDFALHIEKAARESGLFESIKLLEMPFVVLKGANMPAVLIEVAFLSNPESLVKLKREEYRHQIALVLYRGILSYIQNKD